MSYNGLPYLPHNLGLKMSRSTKFSTNFLMIGQLIRVSHELEQTVINPDWTACVNKLSSRNNDQRGSAIEAYQIKANVNNDKFWASCSNYYHILKRY